MTFIYIWWRTAETSILAAVGSLIAPISAPLGFGDWQCSTAPVTELMSKGTITGTGDPNALALTLPTLFTPLSAYAFLIFTLLYMPCVATFAVTRRELGKMRYTLTAVLLQTSVAWVCACLVYQIGRLFL